MFESALILIVILISRISKLKFGGFELEFGSIEVKKIE